MMKFEDFKIGEEFIYVIRIPYSGDILSIWSLSCKDILKTCIKTACNKKLSKKDFVDCYPLEEYQSLKKQRDRFYIDQQKHIMKDKSLIELKRIMTAAGELMQEKNKES